MKRSSKRNVVSIATALALCAAVRGVWADDVIQYSGGTYTQDFNSLWTNSTMPPQTLTSQGLLPVQIAPAVGTPVALDGPSQDAFGTIGTISSMTGWSAVNFGGNSTPLVYDVDDGADSNNALTAFFNPNDPMNQAGSTENNMALGVNAASSTGNVVFGMELVNNSSVSLNAISISYTGEMFYEDTGAKSLNFGYLLANGTIGATIPISGVTTVGSLNVSFPTGTAGSANASEVLSVANLPLSGSWAPGQGLWITWQMGSGGGGQGLAIDDLSFSATSVAGSPTLVWNVNGGGAWDTASPNWTGSTNIFANSSFNVQFGNTNTPSTIAIDPAGVTVASSVTVNNMGSGAYTFTGGSINGTTASLNIQGGTVILQSPNGYGLATNITGGVLVADNNNELGATAAVLNLDGGTFELAGTISAGTRVLQVNAASTFNTNGFTASFGANAASVPVIHTVLTVTGGGDLNLGIQPAFGNAAAPAGGLVIAAGTTVTLMGNTRSSATDMWNGAVINGVLELNTTVFTGPVTGGGRFNFDAPGTFNQSNGTDTGTNGSDVFSGTGFIQVDQGSHWIGGGTAGLDSNGVVISNASGALGAEINVGIHLNGLEGTAGHPAFVETDVTDGSFFKKSATPNAGNFITVIGGTKDNGSGKGGIGPGFTDLIIAGVISGDSDLNIGNDYKSGGSGNLTLDAQNTYTGITMLNGGGNGTPVLYLGVNNALPVTTDVVFSTLSGAGTPSIDLSGHDQTIRSLSVATGGESPNFNQINNSGPQESTLTISGSVSPFYPYAGQINDYGPTATDPLGSNFISFAGSQTALVKAGSSTMVLGIYVEHGITSNSSYTGGTTVQGGVLQIAFDGALGASTGTATVIGTIATAGPVTFDGGAIEVEDPFLLFDGDTGETSLSWASDRPINVTANGGTIQTPVFQAIDTNSVSHSLVESVIFSGVGGYNWGGTLALTGDIGSNMTINGGAGLVSVSNHAAINIGPNVSLSVGGASDPFTDSVSSTRHAAIQSNGSFSVTTGSVAIASLTGTGNASVAPGASLTSDGVRIGGSLSVGGLLTIRAGDGSAGTSVLSSVPAIGGGGTLDLTDSRMIIETTGTTGNMTAVISQLQTLIAQGKAGGSWTGAGITSSTVAGDFAAGTNNSFHTVLAIVNNGAYPAGTGMTMFGGQPVDGNSILITRALAGDANLDGTVNNTDLVALLTHFTESGQTQATGDFNGDGTVDNTDLVALLTDYTQSLPGVWILCRRFRRAGWGLRRACRSRQVWQCWFWVRRR